MSLFSKALGALTGGEKSSSSSVSGFNSMTKPQQQYTNNQVWNAVTKQFETPYESMNSASYIAGLSPEMEAAIAKVGSGAPLGNGGMIAGQKGVTGMNNFASKFADPYMQQAGDLTAQGAKSIGFNEVEAARNPYSGALQSRLATSAQKAIADKQAQLNMRGGRSFGDVSAGTQLGAIEAERLAKSSDIDYQTYQDALAQLNTERNRSMTGGGQFGNLAGQAQNITNDQFNNEMKKYQTQFDMGQGITEAQRQSANDMLKVGGIKQAQQQSVNDANMKDELARRGYNQQQITDFMSNVKGFQSNVDNNSSTKSSGIFSQLSDVGKSVTGLGQAAGVVKGWF